MSKGCVLVFLLLGLLHSGKCDSLLSICSSNTISVVMDAGLGGTYCYRCVSTHPGCGTPFNWYWHTGQWCPEEDDICVKLIERKGGA